MSHVDTVRELVSILTPQNEARPTVLLGACASFSSGVPLADESVKRIARRYYAERITGKALPEQVKTSEWLASLAEQTWFIRDPSRLSENLPLAAVREPPAGGKAPADPAGISAKSSTRSHCTRGRDWCRLSPPLRTRAPGACRYDPDHKFRYPPRSSDEILSIAGAPAPPKIAVQIYTQATATKMIAHCTQQGQSMDAAIAWATSSRAL